MSGLVPMFGGVIGELITKIIPDKRTERIVGYVRDLNEASEAELDAILENPERIVAIGKGCFDGSMAKNWKPISDRFRP